MRSMTDTNDPNFWKMAAEQTPTVIQWAFTILTFGVFTLAGWLWKRHQENTERIERQLNQRLDHTEDHINKRMDGIEDRLSQSMSEVNKHLIEIAANTRKPDADK